MKSSNFLSLLVTTSLLLSQAVQANQANDGDKQQTKQFISRSVKFSIKTKDGEPIPNVKITAHKTFTVLSLGLFSSGHFGTPQLSLHAKELRNEQADLGATNEQGEFEVASYTWDKDTLKKDYFEVDNLKVAYSAKSVSDYSVYECSVSENDLDATVTNEPLNVNCIGYRSGQ